MTKCFLEVFPTLNIAESLKELLGLVQVEKVTTTRDRSSIRIYLKSARLIHKQNIYDLERGIRDQLVPDSTLQVVYILFMYQPCALQINADRASIPGGGHLLHLDQA